MLCCIQLVSMLTMCPPLLPSSSARPNSIATHVRSRTRVCYSDNMPVHVMFRTVLVACEFFSCSTLVVNCPYLPTCCLSSAISFSASKRF